MSLSDYQRSFLDLLFKKDFEKPLAELTDDPRSEQRFRVYRRMARHRLTDVVESCFPRLKGALGDLEPIVERWFDEAPPRSPYIRDVAMELVRWLRADVLPADAPPWALELARHEQALLEVEYAGQESGAEDVREIGELDFNRPAILTPAHKIVRAHYGVHLLPEEIDRDTAVAEGPFALCLYRDPASHVVRVLELSPVAAAILEEVSRGDSNVVDAVRAAAAREGVAVDGALVGSFAELVSDLAERGVWLGAKPV
jgi:uncharacterized protein